MSIFSAAHNAARHFSIHLCLDSYSPQDGNTDTASALMSLFTNPIFISALAASSQTAASSQAQQYNNTHLYTQLLSSSMPPQQLLNASTPFQQTRSGRISRPPTQPSYDFLQALTTEGDSATFEGLLGLLAGTSNNLDPNASSTNGTSSGVQDLNGMNGNTMGYGSLNALGSHTNTPTHTENRTSTNGSASLNAGSLAGGSGWTAQTLADATGQHSVHFALPMTDSDGGRINGKAVKLPEWPLPPQGPGSRLAMSAEEIAARRRVRNKAAGA